jgi:hypothetical protein
MIVRCDECNSEAVKFFIIDGLLYAECLAHYTPHLYHKFYELTTKLSKEEYQLLKVKEHI